MTVRRKPQQNQKICNHQHRTSIAGGVANLTNKEGRDMTQATAELKKEQNKYNIAAFSTADSLLLPDLFRKIYGEHYLAGEVYDPAHYIQANETGDAISIVARGPDGLPVGHVALVASAPYRGVREVGQGVVDPACRGGGILNGMIDEAIVQADRDPQVCGLYGASLTNHTFSQRSVWRAEFVDVGFEIGFVPARMMQIEAEAKGPVATCLQYLPLGDAPMQRTFLPGRARSRFACGVTMIALLPPSSRIDLPRRAPTTSPTRLPMRHEPVADTSGTRRSFSMRSPIVAP